MVGLAKGLALVVRCVYVQGLLRRYITVLLVGWGWVFFFVESMLGSRTRLGAIRQRTPVRSM